MKLGIAGIVKDEADSLLEWIAYHRIIGVTHFFIANNDSTDGTRDMLAALENCGIVTLIDFPTIENQKPQLPAYASLLDLSRKSCDAIAFIDADEFLVPTDGASTVTPIIDKIFSDPSVSAIAVNWANFGSSGHLFIEDGLVIDRFTRRAKRECTVNHHYKTIVRPDRALHFHNPHHVNLESGRYVTTNERDIVPHIKHGNGLSNSVIWDGVRVNHYATKSLEEFLLGKSKRGSASKEGRIKHKRYFLHHDRNDEECLIAAHFSIATKAEMDNLSAMINASPELPTPANKSRISKFFTWSDRK
ncbi:glycosyl transferase [Burkholderia sp. IDO3]|nr:glycosyltransferase family 2 protein [Burkholderia sp. IDO3]PCD60660.1 glycosyl transferase [Burkholderia sp. IDO3]